MNTQNNKPVIALDIDDVLAANASGFVVFSNETWGTSLTVDDFQEDFGKMWGGISHDEVTERMREYANKGTAAHYDHFEEAIPVLKELSKRFTLTLVTSRRKWLEELTAAWVKKHFGDMFAGIRHCGFYDNLKPGSYEMTKADICRELGASYLIDDQLKHCNAAADAGIKAVLFGDYSWNKSDTLPKLVHRALTWQEVKEYFDGE